MIMHNGNWYILDTKMLFENVFDFEWFDEENNDLGCFPVIINSVGIDRFGDISCLIQLNDEKDVPEGFPTEVSFDFLRLAR